MGALSDITNNQMVDKVLLGLAILLVVIFIYKKYINTENFKQESPVAQHVNVVYPETTTMPHEYIASENELQVVPTHHIPDTRTIMSGTGYVPHNEIMTAWGTLENNDEIDSETNTMKFNFCSSSCCSAQYPTPHVFNTDVDVNQYKDSFVSTSHTCNNAWQNGGCLCMTNEQSEFLASRGGNA